MPQQKGGVEGTHQTQQKRQKTEVNEVSPKKRACQLYGPSQSPYSIGPLAWDPDKTGGRREIEAFISSRKEDSLREREDEKEQNIFDDNEREYQD